MNVDGYRLFISGTVVSGNQSASFFTQLSFVQEQFRKRLGNNVHPGTLNLKLDRYNQELLQTLLHDQAHALPKIRSEHGYCAADLIPVKLRSQSSFTEGAIIYPAVKDYPKNKVEVVSPFFLKQQLQIDNGDVISLYVKGLTH